MCLAVPGKIISMTGGDESLLSKGRVSFGGIIKEVSLAYVPDARVSDYVIVHAGFAISVLDEEEARATLEQFDDLAGHALGEGQ
jgi:hydrogenase expression/formation protein HypC